MTSLNFSAPRADWHRRLRAWCFVVLKPEEFVGKILIGVFAEQEQDAPEQFAEGKVIRNDNPPMVLARNGILSGKRDEVFYIQSEDCPILLYGKIELLRIGTAAIIRLRSRETIDASLSEYAG